MTATGQGMGGKDGSDVRDTVQAKLTEVGLLPQGASGTGWQLTQQARELLSATLTKPCKSTLAADLLGSDPNKGEMEAAVLCGEQCTYPR